MRDNYRRSQKPISLTKWSQRLGYKSSRSLGMLIEGQRLPSLKMLEVLAKDYGLTELERRYLELLILSAKESKDELRKKVEQELQNIKELHQRQERQLTMTEFENLFQWYVFVIRQLVSTKGFKEDPLWIRKKLRNKVTVDQIQEAIKNLISVGGLFRDPMTQKLKRTEINYMSKTDIPSLMIRQHHQDMIERAKESIQEQGVYERELMSWVFTCDKSELNTIKQILREMRDTVDKRFSKKNADTVFQLNVQLFQHTVELPTDLISDPGEKNEE